MNQIIANNVSVSLSNQQILKEISLEAKSGEFIGLIGSNGSGKSTLLRALCGLIPFQHGKININGKEISHFIPKEMARIIGYVPQDTSLGFDFLVREIVLMGRHVHIPRFGVEGPKDFETAEAAMARTSITHLADRYVTSLSGGQRQMVFIAKALAQEPGILLFDEPISALDINRQLQVLELIRTLSYEGVLAIAALHDLNLAARYCDRLILIKEGQVIASGSPEEVLTVDTLQSSYGVHSVIREDVIVNARSITAISYDLDKKKRETSQRSSIHVIAGAGKASKLLTALYRHKFHVTVGPIEEHDPDALLAKELGMKVIAYPSYTPMSNEIVEQSRSVQNQADYTIVAPVPIGHVNRGLTRLLDTQNLLVLAQKDFQGPGLTDDLGQNGLSIREIVERVTEKGKWKVAL
ncbi:iron complex transport system ATP-binding protein [Evansella vedderi]|uniref:Iron complex transport system ATP-binding protein n=1 Tax=Evansella vedderi TaxID=38282 RepID=A0ABU0A4M8_9BACI|nr:ATP-binding cassette domain-containing protein [Evansella vedderi]MDQ0257290.1 iron complex transport system ATP-binding protein [Evansella vedderi]